MDWTGMTPPSLAQFDQMTRDAFAALPARFREPCGDVVICVAEFADEDTLAELEIEDPFELTGLYRGVDLTRKSDLDPAPEPDMVFLYRRPLLDEWVERENVTLGELISHVLVHEIGHHFGFSDDAMHAVEDQAD